MDAMAGAASFLTFFIRIPMHAGLIAGEDHPSVVNTCERYIRDFYKQREQSAAPVPNAAAVTNNATDEEAGVELTSRMN